MLHDRKADIRYRGRDEEDLYNEHADEANTKKREQMATVRGVMNRSDIAKKRLVSC